MNETAAQYLYSPISKYHKNDKLSDNGQIQRSNLKKSRRFTIVLSVLYIPVDLRLFCQRLNLHSVDKEHRE